MEFLKVKIKIVETIELMFCVTLRQKHAHINGLGELNLIKASMRG